MSVFFQSDNIVSPAGLTTRENFAKMYQGISTISETFDKNYYPEAFQASVLDMAIIDAAFQKVAQKYSKVGHYTKLEKMLIISIDDAISRSNIDVKSTETAIILSTTKGNIDLLSPEKYKGENKDRVLLWKLGEVVNSFFDNPNAPIVISNACISGVVAINTAALYIETGEYENVIVTGGDIVSKFVVSGFMSFLSLSEKPCKPFDKQRDGLSLGEAASTIVLSKNKFVEPTFEYIGGGSSNDANHISGPSRTGEGSYLAIKRALDEARISAADIDHISAHGTATSYNDEMESIAITRHGLQNAPVNSFKGFLGHTLGAAGIVETSLLLEEMRNNQMLSSKGFTELGVSNNINVINKSTRKNLAICLKMASGFGGSNAALLIRKR